ncbi:hypothetical protein Noda2021_08550 [Candidatus Dependentiae bacterium Noda2021]|nr:hypothetical protein Noda2021_08550 [Candidatus Dependentiae bacterium Noda2021]
MRIGVFVFILNMPLLTLPYIYNLTFLQNADFNIKALSDYHDKDHQSTYEQSFLIRDYLSTCCPKTTKVIVEDLTSLTSQTSNHGLLSGLASYCKSCNLLVQNVEYRALRVKALAPFVYEPLKNPFDCPDACTITIGQLLQELTNVTKDMASFQFPRVLHKSVAKIIADTQKNVADLKWHDALQMSVAEYVGRIPPHERLMQVKKMLMCDVKLFDLCIVARVLEKPYQQTLIFAGGSHVDQVVQLLKKIGYKSLLSTKPSFFTETDLTRCVTAHIYNNSYCLKPHPVDIKLLTQKSQGE